MSASSSQPANHAATPPRRDARQEREQRLLARHVGLDGSGTSATVVSQRGENIPEHVAVVTVPDAAPWCLVVPDAQSGQLSAHDLDTLGAARVIADFMGGGVLVLTPAGIEDWGTRGADRVMAYSPQEPCGGEGVLALIEEVIEQYKPLHVLLPDTPLYGGHLARQLAVRRMLVLVTGVKHLTAQAVIRCADAGRTDQHISLPPLLAVLPEAATLVNTPLREARELACLNYRAPVSALQHGEVLPPDSLTVPVGEADFIISGGAGVTDWSGLSHLAGRLGAALGATRAVCDTGIVPRDRQIGISGSLVSARGYLCFGISGASQHLQGLTRCERVIAVNTDLHAEMIKRADIAVIADAQEVIRALLDWLEP